MRPLFIIILFFLVCNTCFLVGDVLGEKELGYLKEGLGSYNLTLDELKFDRKWVTDDTFRLKVVTRLMDSPLEVPDFIEQEGNFCDSVDQFSLSELLFHTSFLIDAPISVRDLQKNIR